MPLRTSSKPITNGYLSKAKEAKKDEFYTQLADVENELKYYREHFRDKTVLCNCDDPYESNFFRYFALNFKSLGLKKLITTSYAGSNLAGSKLPLINIEGLKPGGREPYAIEISQVTDTNGDGAIDLADVEWLLRNSANSCRTLEGDDQYDAGDFRSKECLRYLKESDIIVTNPPFSLFREFISLIVSNSKHFIIIGNMNATTYKGIFTLIRDNKIWYGASINSGDREFQVPDDYPLEAANFRTDNDGRKFIRVKGVRWYTNLDHARRHIELNLYMKYSKTIYNTYDNYDAIDVQKYSEIPVDYFGVMGVPITILDHFNPKQFEILGCNRDIDQDPTRYYGRSSLINGKETFKRIFLKRRVVG
jgi:hypothetical protein